MSKKFFTSEVKIGLAFIAAIAILIIGINFLKGINIFTPSNHYYVEYENLDGLVVSNSVMIRGYKVGQVREISYDFTKTNPFTVHIAINKDIKLPLNTEACLYDDGLVGGKAIELVFDNEDNYYTPGSTLPATIKPGMFAALAEMIPDISRTLSRVDSLLVSATDLINSEDISSSIESIKVMTNQFKQTSYRVNNFMNNQFPSIANNIDTMIIDLKSVGKDLQAIEYQKLITEATAAVENLRETTEKLNSNDNTIGLLMNDKAVYDSLQSTVNSANQLLIDLKKNPKRYVHFSMFGKKEKTAK